MIPDHDLCPRHTRDTIDRYVTEGLPPGGFTLAMLENDLREAVMRADHINIENIPNILAYLYHRVPAICWGSPERVETWLSCFPKSKPPK